MFIGCGRPCRVIWIPSETVVRGGYLNNGLLFGRGNGICELRFGRIGDGGDGRLGLRADVAIGWGRW